MIPQSVVASKLPAPCLGGVGTGGGRKGELAYPTWAGYNRGKDEAGNRASQLAVVPASWLLRQKLDRLIPAHQKRF